MERFQHTIRHSISAKGIGLHSGKEVSMTLNPAPANTGVEFRRMDLPRKPSIKLSAENIVETPLCTSLVKGDIKISTIEHLLSALSAYEIDNIEIELNAAELPIMDGSSAPFCFLLESAGRAVQKKARLYKRILAPISVKDGDKLASFSPGDEEEFHMEFSIDFDHPVIAKTPSKVRYILDAKTYSKEISRARSFGFSKDLEALHQKHLALGASLDNVIGVGETSVLNPGGLRYEDEFVRHKLLDAVGDLYAIGPIIGRFKGHKSGHGLNNQLLRKLLSTKDAYEVVTLDSLEGEK